MYSIQMYGRNSFDRFGDDLCCLILSNLSISDSFRLQYVSKQWKHLIFNHQTRLALTTGEANYTNERYNEIWLTPEYGYNTTLEYVLSKCVNIKQFTIDGDYILNNETIEIITDACNHIKRLSIYTTANMYHLPLNYWKYFIEKSLQHLETFAIYTEISEEHVDVGLVSMIIELCPKLKSIYSYAGIEKCFDSCLTENLVIRSKIDTIDRYSISNQRFITFAENFKDQLKSLHVSVNMLEVDLHLLKQLATFTKLECLGCDFSMASEDDCIKLLKLVGNKCLRLKALEIEALDFALKDVFDNGFRSIKKLALRKCFLFDNLDSLKKCVRLTHLQFNEYYSEASEFMDLHLYLPQLKSIDICLDGETEKEDIVTVLKHLEKLPNLCDLKIGCEEEIGDNYDDSEFITSGVVSLIKHCLTIKRIGIYPENENINVIEDYIQLHKRKIIVNTLHAH